MSLLLRGVVVGFFIVQVHVLVLGVENVDMEVAVEVDVDVDVDVNGAVDVDVVVVVVMHPDLLINVQGADDNASQRILAAWSQAMRHAKQGRCSLSTKSHGFRRLGSKRGSVKIKRDVRGA